MIAGHFKCIGSSELCVSFMHLLLTECAGNSEEIVHMVCVVARLEPCSAFGH